MNVRECLSGAGEPSLIVSFCICSARLSFQRISTLWRVARRSPITHTWLESDFCHENGILERNTAGIFGHDKTTVTCQLFFSLGFQVTTIRTRGPALFYLSRLWLLQTATSPDESPESKRVSTSHDNCLSSPRKQFPALLKVFGSWEAARSLLIST